MLQHTNTYTTEKLYQYQQEQLKRIVNKALLIAEAEAEVEKQAGRKKGSMRRWLEKWRFVTSMK